MRIADTVLFQYATPSFTATQLTFTGTWDARYYRVLIHNGDNAPLVWNPEVMLRHEAETILFGPTSAERTYTLYYRGKVAAPNYDLAVFSRYVASDRGIATLGVSAPNPHYTGNGDTTAVVPLTERYRVELNIFLVLLVVGVGFLSYRAYKTQPKDETSPPPAQ